MYELFVCPTCGAARVVLLGENSFYTCGGGVHLPGVSGGRVSDLHKPVPCQRVEVVEKAELEGKVSLDEVLAAITDLRLHDDTGDPHDEGYMAALDDLERRLRDGGKER